MSQLQYTPGPRTIEEETDGNVLVLDEQGVTICRCYQQPHDTWKARDNALLIAASSKFFEVLQEMEAYFLQFPESTVIAGGEAMEPIRQFFAVYKERGRPAIAASEPPVSNAEILPANTSDTPVPDVRIRNKAIVFAALAEAGMHRVTADYDGSGDSGQIENVEAWDAGNERLPFPSDRRIQLVSENPDRPCAEHNLEAAVESVAWDYLDDLYRGWENNDGAFGIFVFDVPRRTLTLEHNERYTEHNTTNHEF
jgi:hypothetical protein